MVLQPSTTFNNVLLSLARHVEEAPSSPDARLAIWPLEDVHDPIGGKTPPSPYFTHFGPLQTSFPDMLSLRVGLLQCTSNDVETRGRCRQLVRKMVFQKVTIWAEGKHFFWQAIGGSEPEGLVILRWCRCRRLLTRGGGGSTPPPEKKWC